MAAVATTTRVFPEIIPFNESSIKTYLKKYNNDYKGDGKINDVVEKIDNYKMSEKYKNDYQYARAYDLIRGLIIREKKIK